MGESERKTERQREREGGMEGGGEGEPVFNPPTIECVRPVQAEWREEPDHGQAHGREHVPGAQHAADAPEGDAAAPVRRVLPDLQDRAGVEQHGSWGGGGLGVKGDHVEGSPRQREHENRLE